MDNESVAAAINGPALLMPLTDEFTAHYLTLVRLAAQLVDDQHSAEDVVQDVFTRLHANPPEHPLTNSLAYLRRAVLNEARSALRRRRVRRRWTPWAYEGTSPAADQPVLGDAEAAQVLHAVDGLPQRQREVVVLRYYEELTIADIAYTLNLTSSAVTSSLGRALTTLKATLGEADGN